MFSCMWGNSYQSSGNNWICLYSFFGNIIPIYSDGMPSVAKRVIACVYMVVYCVGLKLLKLRVLSSSSEEIRGPNLNLVTYDELSAE